MGRRTKRKHREDTPTSPSSSDDDEDTDSSIERRRSRHRNRGRSDGSSRRDKDRKREKEDKRRRKDRDRERKRRKSKKRRDYESESSASGSGSEDREIDRVRVNPGDVVKEMLSEFPNVGGDLKQLLQMIDDGQAVDIKGISERSLIKHLKRLFISLNLKENGDRVFLLRPKAGPTLEVVGPLIQACAEPKEQQGDHSIPSDSVDSMPPDAEHKQETDDNNVAVPSSRDDASAPRRRVIGPEMPSAELLAAAAKLTEAQAELREAELEEDTELFIGPAPPAVVAEAASANEAERFEEVTRIMDAVGDSLYDVVGVNRNMSADNIKKRYWKLSLLVHPDKCSHPQAHQAFVKLNKAFKDLQDPEKRKLLDDEIKRKEEQEAFKAELRAMREAAQWRRLQGISMEGDDELLAETEVKVAPSRDEWMTTLPPERKPGGMPTQSRSFSKNSKEGRGDTSVWTDNPLDRAQKAKMNYLEAYNEAAALASTEEEKQRASADADLVDKYNKAKRSKSLVQKHQEEASSRTKKKSKQKKEKEEWAEATELGKKARELKKAADVLHQEERSGNKGRKWRKNVKAVEKELLQLEEDVKLLEEVYPQGEKAETSWALTVLGYLAKLVLGILGLIVSVAWVAHIIIYLLIDPPLSPFLNEVFIKLDDIWGLLGTVAFAFFCFYLLLAVIAGAMMLGLRLVFITIHPMKWGATLMNSFLFNVGLILLCSISVIQFCATAFGYYAQATAAQEIFGHTLQSLRGIKYLYKYNVFQIAFVVLAGLTFVYYAAFGWRRKKPSGRFQLSS